MNRFWLFENINLFDLLCPHKVARYATTHAFVSYNKGDFVYVEGDVAKNFFLINTGKIKIGFWDESGEEIVTAYLSRGDVFGEHVVLDQPIRKEFAQAITSHTTLCPVTLKQAEELMRGYKNFSTGIYKFIGYKLRKIERRYHMMLFRSTRVRAMEFIKELKEEDPNVVLLINGDMLIHHPYSQAEIAKLIGTSRPTFNILIRELEEEGFLLWQKKKILLKKKFLLDV